MLSVISLIIIIFLTKWVYRWRYPKSNGILPPGSSGIPLIGESLQLIIPNYSIDVHPFFKKRLERYGPLFRTNVAGRNVVISADQEFNNFLFQQEEKLVVRWYLDSLGKLFTMKDDSSPDGISIHKYVRNSVLTHFGVECIKKTLLSRFEQVVKTTLRSWSDHDSLDFESAAVDMFGEFGGKILYNYDAEKSKELVHKLTSVLKGYMSFPLYIPGTTYYNCLKVKEEVNNMIKGIVNDRLASPHINTEAEDDLVSKMMRDMKTVKFLSLENITTLLFGLSFVSNHSIPPTLAFAVKFITETPAVLHELIAEHQQIVQKRLDLDSPITWDEYKSMTFTHQVVNETLRLRNGLPGFFRKAVKDINIKGYTIPAGWGIMACQSAVHLDPNIYKDPLKFDPWRWKDVKPEFISKNLRPFGGGIAQCSGADFTKASISIFLHVLVTKYSWTIGKGDVVQDPTQRFKNGLCISVSEK